MEYVTKRLTNDVKSRRDITPGGASLPGLHDARFCACRPGKAEPPPGENDADQSREFSRAQTQKSLTVRSGFSNLVGDRGLLVTL